MNQRTIENIKIKGKSLLQMSSNNGVIDFVKSQIIMRVIYNTHHHSQLFFSARQAHLDENRNSKTICFPLEKNSVSIVALELSTEDNHCKLDEIFVVAV